MKMYKMKGKTAAKAVKTLIMLAAAGLIVYAVMQMNMEAPPPVGAARWVPPVMTIVPEVSRPMSTPTMLASKNGLGGGAFVGSQSLKLGGSSFKPGRNVLYNEFGIRQYQPWPLYKPPPPPPEPSPSPVPASVDGSQAPVAPVAPVAPTTAALGASAAAKGRRSAPFGGSVISRPRAPTDILIETRDGYIVQPRA